MSRVIAIFGIILFSITFWRILRIYLKTRMICYLLISLSLFIWSNTLILYLFSGENKLTDILAILGVIIYLFGKLYGSIIENNEDWERYIRKNYGVFWLLTGNFKEILNEEYNKKKIEFLHGKKIYGIIYGVPFCILGYIIIEYFYEYDVYVVYFGFFIIIIGALLFVFALIDYIFCKFKNSIKS